MKLVALVLLVCTGLGAQKADSLLERIRNSPLPAEKREELARLYAARNFAEMQSLLKRQTPSAELRALAGAVDFLNGRMTDAAAAFRESDAVSPLSDPDRFTFAMALVNGGDSKAAREQLMRLQGTHPDNPIYLYWLGRMDYDQRLYQEAVERFQRVIKLDPGSSRAYDNLGLALDMLGQPDAAEQAFRKGVELNRKLPQPSAWPPQNLGTLLLRLQRLDEAEAALREALRYDPHLPMAHYHLGRVLDAGGRDNDAIAEYRASATADPPVVEALYSLGLVYRRNDRAAEAEAAFAEYKRIRALTPN